MQIRNLNFNVRTAGTGTPFVWSHGLISSMATEDRLDWFQWGSFPSSLKLVRYDVRGHGKTQASYKPEDYHWRSLGQDMLAVADTTGEHAFIAGGTSIGAATALYAALQSSGRVQALVLVNPPSIWEKRGPLRPTYQRRARLGGLLGGRLLARVQPSRAEEALPAWLIEADPEKYQVAPESLPGMGGRTLGALLRGAAETDLPTREVLAAGLRDIPTLIIASADDPAHPVWSAEELQRHLPKAELFVAKNYADFQSMPQRMRRFITTTLHYQPPPIHY
jgi:3-oxoadipate enol-lactonase